MICCAGLLTGCGERYHAKNLVQDFMSQNLKNPEYDVEDISDLDSTYYINSKMLKLMQHQAASLTMYKPLNFKDKKASAKLLFLRVKFSQNGQSYNQTFYMDDQLEHVVGVKNY